MPAKFASLKKAIVAHKVISKINHPLERTRVIFAVSLAFIEIAILIGIHIFAKVNNYGGDAIPFLPYAIAVKLAVIVIALKGNYRFGMALGLILTIGFLIIISQRAGLAAGANYYFLVLALLPFVFFGYRDRWKALSLFILASFGYLATLKLHIPWIDPLSLTTDQLANLNIINTNLTIALSAFCLMMISRMNFESEKQVIKRQQLAEARNEELKKANQELDKFVYSASHDLSAPLNSLLGLIELLGLHPSKEKSDQYLQLMVQSINQQRKFIGDIVNYSRNSRLPIKSKPINLIEVIEEVWRDHQYSMTDMAKPDFQLQLNGNPVINSDDTRLRIVFNNLFSNAIKFQLKGGQHQPYVHTLIDIRPDEVHISVTDNGKGIAADELPQIFDMFYRANDGVPGSGLGLYILRETVDKLDGKINVRSEVGNGTTFEITLPRS